jgi:hypothetical protein
MYTIEGEKESVNGLDKPNYCIELDGLHFAKTETHKGVTFIIFATKIKFLPIKTRLTTPSLLMF